MAPRKYDEVISAGYDGRNLKRGLKDARERIKRFATSTTAIVAAAGAAIAGLSVRAFAEQEKSERKLRRALTATGQYSEETERKLQKVAQRIQATTKIGDEQAQAMMAQMIQIGRVAPEEAGKAVEAIAGIAELTGKNITRVGRTLANNLAIATRAGSTSLGEIENELDANQIAYIKRLKKTGTAAQVTAALVDALNQKYAVQGRVIGGSTDEWKQVGNLWGDFVELIGMVVQGIAAKLMPSIKAVLNGLITAGKHVVVFATQIGERFDLLGSRIKLFWESMNLAVVEFRHGVVSGFEDMVNGVIGTLNKMLATLPDWMGGERRIEPVQFGGGLDARVVELRDKVGELRTSVEEDAAAISGAFDDVDASIAAIKDPVLGDKTNQDAPDQSTGEAEDLTDLNNRLELLKAAHQGMEDAELAFIERMQGIAKTRAEAEKIIAEDGNLEKARLMQEAADLEEQQAIEDFARAREQAAKIAETEAAEKEHKDQIDAEARALAVELGWEQHEENMEFLRERIVQEREIKLEAADQERADRLDAHKKYQQDEKKHGKFMAKLIRAGRSKELKIGQAFLDAGISLTQIGSKKMQKIGEAFERARLLLLLATKPFEAYAETSSKYPAPVGPALGAAHAAVVAAQIASGLRAVGGGGGGGDASSGGDVTVPSGDAGSGAGGGGIDDEEEQKPQEITLHLNVDLDGYSIARQLETIRIQSEDL